MQPFIYCASASRVIFGSGSVGRAPDEIDRLAAKRVFVIGTPSALGPVSPVLAQLGPSPTSRPGSQRRRAELRKHSVPTPAW